MSRVTEGSAAPPIRDAPSLKHARYQLAYVAKWRYDNSFKSRVLGLSRFVAATRDLSHATRCDCAVTALLARPRC